MSEEQTGGSDFSSFELCDRDCVMLVYGQKKGSSTNLQRSKLCWPAGIELQHQGVKQKR